MMPDFDAQFKERHNPSADKIEDIREGSILAIMDMAIIAFNRLEGKTPEQWARETIHALNLMAPSPK